MRYAATEPSRRSRGITAFSLLVLTARPHPTRLFLKKSRTSLPCPVQSRSENALVLLLLSAAHLSRAQEVHNTDRAAPASQTFALTDTKDLVEDGVKAEV